MLCPSSSFQTRPRGGGGGGVKGGRKINNVIGPVMKKKEEGNEAEGSFHSVASCVWKLVDVSQVGVVEDDPDSVQGLGLSYPLHLYLRTQTHNHPFSQIMFVKRWGQKHKCRGSGVRCPAVYCKVFKVVQQTGRAPEQIICR